ncbi:MAG: amidohydrolase family protein [Geodermatophilaceae bacterium]|nr:amidohydrolase family protein [Geodermatophilaceae bacterium]
MTRTLYTGGQLFDGTGAAPASADVVVEDGRFVEIGSGLDGDEQVDCTGKSLLPGLFDCHVHVMFSGIDVLRMMQTPFSYPFFEAIHNLRSTLDQGITMVRDAGGADLGVQQAINNGLITGPRMQISLGMLSQTGGHGDDWMPCGASIPLLVEHPGRPSTVVDGPDEMRRKVRELIRNGADVIKVATSGGVLSPRSDPRRGHFRDEEIAVLVEEATAAGRFVMAHAQATDGIKVAIRNGVRSIEHGIFLDDEAIEMMLAAGTWLVPTLAAPRAVLALADLGAGLPQHMIDKARMVVDVHTESVRRAIAAGVAVAMGTDSGVGSHGDNLRELTLMTDCGMTPAGALHATSLSAARLLGVDDDLGSIEVGKRADLVLVDGDALEVDTLGARIHSVYSDGKLVAEPGRAATG